MQNNRNAEKHIRINGRLVIDFIHIRPTARKLACKPNYSLALLIHLLSDKVTYVHSFTSCADKFPDSAIYNKVLEQYKKGVGTSFAYPTNQALALPSEKDKQRQSAHARMMYIDITIQTTHTDCLYHL